MEISRNQMTKLSRGCRIDFPKSTNPDYPLSVKSDEILFNGNMVRRKRIILLTVGCGIGSCAMCPFPAESNINVTGENLINQFKNAFVNSGDSLDDYDHITLFCNGNFFSEREISKKAREYMFQEISKSKASSITIETLPQFINEENIKRTKEILGNKTLQVFMGLQSASSLFRKYSINTTCSLKSFEKAVELLLKYDFLPAAFVLIKPPFLTDLEASIDTLNTMAYLDSVGVKNFTLCPMRVSEGTLLKKIYDSGFYYPLNLWVVVDILIEYSRFGRGLPMVNTTELKQHINEDSACAYSCEKCNSKVIKSIEEYLFSRDIKILEDLKCECYTNAYKDDFNDVSIVGRIKKFYELENRKG